MDNQQAFDKVLKALRAQGRPSVNHEGSCMYRGGHGCKCAVGHLINDDVYTPELESLPADKGLVLKAVQQSLGLRVDVGLLVAMQRAHDRGAELSLGEWLAVFERGMADAATHYQLVYTPPGTHIDEPAEPQLKFFKQAFLHDPENGTYGDCYRTCLAIMLGLERDAVPNFGVHYGNAEAWDAAVRAFLTPRGLFEFSIPFLGTTPLQDILHQMNVLHPGLLLMLSGQSRNGTNHCVLVRDGGILWDPALDNSGIVGPSSDGHWWVAVLAHRARSGDPS